MRTDPVLLEIFRNRFKAAAEEMASVTLRTGFTVFVKETSDFGACIVAPNGETFAAPTDTAVSLMIGLPGHEAINALSDYKPGDIGITNDPELTRGLSTHLPDIWLWKPIFSQGEIIAFGFNFIHSSDVGGKVPGSISPTNTELFQEGLRIPPMKLFREGELDRELLNLILLNCRIPHQNWGDIKAQVASLAMAERRILEIVDRYGHDTVVAGIADILDHGESRARAHIADMPDGRYEFADYMEGDVAGGRPIRINLALTVSGSDMHLDFTGTDPQVQAALNLPTWNQHGHYMLSFGFLNYFRTMEPEIPYNSGLVRPLRMTIPRGSLLNPEPHAAVGVRAATMFRILDVINGCLTQALPEIFPAASSGAVSMILVSTLDVETGERLVSVAQPLSGGSGARPMMDGIDGASFTGGWLRNIPNEMLEADMPVLVEEYGYRPHSAGAGRWRGGSAIRFRMKTFAPETIMTARGLERFTFRPYGLRGGNPGQLGRGVLNPGTPGERNVGKIDVLRLDPGDVVMFESASGGGYGNPLEREPELVLADIAADFINAAQALEDYGVVVRDGHVDEEATIAERAGRSVSEGPFFDGGPERAAHEERWPGWLQAEMATVVLGYPAALRPWLQRKIVDRLNGGTVVEAGGVAGLAAEAVASLRVGTPSPAPAAAATR
ncbi:MAG: N-methylhydantoinase [Thermomicrobiales bacterium]|nr:N-methylhydantoinase [Thermomicrobiales bacterium]